MSTDQSKLIDLIAKTLKRGAIHIRSAEGYVDRALIERMRRAASDQEKP